MLLVKYSFIVPIYNVEKYLNRCIDSLLAQTYKDFEIVLIDDGSTDSSGAIADMYVKKFPQIIRVEHQKNKGLGGARNTGIELAKGDYLVMVDSDDYVSKCLLEVVDRYLIQYDNDLLIFDYIVEEENGSQRIQRLHDINVYTSITSKQFILEVPSACNKVYRTSLFKETGIRFPIRIFYEDLATSPCLAIHAFNIGVIAEALYYYIQRDTSIMHTLNTQKMTEIIPAARRILEYYKQQEKFEEYYEELEYLIVRNVLCSTVQRILQVKYDNSKIKRLEQFVRGYFPNYEQNFYLQNYLKQPGNRREKWIVGRRYGSLFLEHILKFIVKKIMIVFNGEKA